IENSLDVEMAGSLAPGATITTFYFSSTLYYPNATVTNGDIADDFAMTLAAALNYTFANASLAAVTNSYGLPDLNDSLWDAELEHAAAIGVTVVAASGDQGNAPSSLSGRFQGQWPTWPGTAAFDDWGTVAVGGVTPVLQGTPSGTFNAQTGVLNDSFDTSVGGFSSTTAWYDAEGSSVSGTEGGGSPIIPEPDWQFDSGAQSAIANGSSVEGLTTLGRSEPDVSFAANTTIAYISEFENSTYFTVLEGTSIASPLFAGLVASMAADLGTSFGFIDPSLYRIGSFFDAFPSPSSPYLYVTAGSNYVFSAGPGWNPATGWGGIDAPLFVNAFSNRTIVGYHWTGPTPGIPPPPAPSVPSGAGSGPTIPPLWIVLGALGAVVIVLIIVFASVSNSSSTPPAPPRAGYYTLTSQNYPLQAPGFAPGQGAVTEGASATTRANASIYRPAGAWSASGGRPCSYCGQPRPAGQTRCPYCGAF
ncbi:MAG: S8 family serine peptidase, partial [Thermoplasmata archaeon]